MKQTSLVLVFSLFVVAGSFITYRSWNGTVYVFVDDGESRNPAAVADNMDFSKLKGSDLSLASQKRVLQEARITRQTSSVGIELGHFITRRANGKRAFACHLYKKVTMKFVANGIAESGTSPEMSIQGDCEIGESVNRIAPIWIPAKQILEHPPKSMELTFYEPSKIDLSFKNIGSEWPLKWDLVSVTLDGGNGAKPLHISDQEMLSLLKKPITVSWSSLRATASE